MLYNYVLIKKYLLSKITRKYARVNKIIKFYQNIRIGYIIFEAIFFFNFFNQSIDYRKLWFSLFLFTK